MSGWDWLWVPLLAYGCFCVVGALAVWSEERRDSMEPDPWDYQDFIDKKGEWAETPPPSNQLPPGSSVELGKLIVAHAPVRKPNGRVGVLRAAGPNSLLQVQNPGPPYHEWINAHELEPLDPEYAQCLQEAWVEVDALTEGEGDHGAD